MTISARTEYACLAVMELAATYGSGEPVRIRGIAARHEIPARFLVQILLQLKAAGLVTSTRGAAGGYQLAVAPSELTLGRVMCVVEGQPRDVASCAGSQTAGSRVLVAVWNEAFRRQRELLDQITFADLLERARGDEEPMYFI